MKTKLTICLVSAALAVVAGCSKQEPAPQSEQAATNAATGTALQDTAKAVKEQAKEVATSVSQTAEKAAATATAQFENLFSQAKSYVADKKYEDALGTIKQLSNLKLTPEQQKALDNLTQQVQ